jgi:hypothetical protein
MWVTTKVFLVFRLVKQRGHPGRRVWCGVGGLKGKTRISGLRVRTEVLDFAFVLFSVGSPCLGAESASRSCQRGGKGGRGREAERGREEEEGKPPDILLPKGLVEAQP